MDSVSEFYSTSPLLHSFQWRRGKGKGGLLNLQPQKCKSIAYLIDFKQNLVFYFRFPLSQVKLAVL